MNPKAEKCLVELKENEERWARAKLALNTAEAQIAECERLQKAWRNDLMKHLDAPTKAKE